MSNNPPNLKYTKDHEWARQDGNKVVIGVTSHAQEALGDVVYVDLPKPGAQLEAGQPFGTIESTKAVSELFAPISGKVLRVNEAVTADPQTVNRDPFGGGWLVELEPKNPQELTKLLDAAGYEQVLKEGGS